MLASTFFLFERNSCRYSYLILLFYHEVEQILNKMEVSFVGRKYCGPGVLMPDKNVTCEEAQNDFHVVAFNAAYEEMKARLRLKLYD